MQNVTFDSLIIPSFGLNFGLSFTALVSVFIIFLMLYILYSSVLIYHWASYGMKSPEVVFAETLFSLVSIILFVIAGLSVFYLS